MREPHDPDHDPERQARLGAGRDTLLTAGENPAAVNAAVIELLTRGR